MAKVCRRKNKRKVEQTHAVAVEQVQTEDHQDQEYTMFHVQSGPNKPYKTVVQTKGKPLSMEIDTGASVYVVGEEMPQEGQSTLELQKSTVWLRTYTGELITVGGSALIPVEHNGQRLALVTAGNGPPLLGRDWLAALHLDWKMISSVGTHPSLQQVLGKYADDFKEGLGELRGVEAKIHLNKEERPRFVEARQVPFATRQKEG